MKIPSSGRLPDGLAAACALAFGAILLTVGTAPANPPGGRSPAVDTFTPTPTFTETPTHTFTPTRTWTPTRTFTPTPSVTPTPTVTPTPSPAGTPTPPPVSAATTLVPLPPCRVLDTRDPAGPLGGPLIGAMGSRVFVASSVCGVPPGAVAISANVAVVSPATTGDLVLYPNGLPFVPGSSTMSFRAGVTRANNVLVYLAVDGSFVVKNNSAGAFHFLLDVNGYFE